MRCYNNMGSNVGYDDVRRQTRNRTCNRTDILIVCSILRVVVCVDIKVGCSDGRKTHHEFQEQDTDRHARNHFMTLTPPP